MKRFLTATKIFIIALLGYYVLHVIYNITYDLVHSIVFQLPRGFIVSRLDDIALILLGMLSFFVSGRLVHLLTRDDEKLGKVMRIIGIMCILNHAIFLFQWFFEKDGYALQHICYILMGFLYISVYKSTIYPE